MSIARQDAWNQDEDLLLAEVVLRHIREGSTQLKAFEEVGRQLSRTSAACGFRWNSYVRKQYKSGIELAKKSRKEAKKQLNLQLEEKRKAKEVSASTNSTKKTDGEVSISLREVIRFLEEIEETNQTSLLESQSQIEECEVLRNENQQLLNKNQSLRKQLQVVEEDYKALLHIMEKARKLIVHEDDSKSKVKFQMDKNGNLERVNK